VVSKDEYGELTRAFNKMTGELKHSYDHLEELVESRTRELKIANERLQQQNEYLAALHETTLALINRLELADLLEVLIARAGVMLGTQHGFIYLVEPGEVEAILRVGVGIYTKYVGYRLKPGEGVAGQVWQTGQPLAMNGYQTWSGRLSVFSGEIVHAVVAAPLKSGPRVVGIIGLAYLDEGPGFRTDESLLLSRFAELASIAFDNAQLYTAAQQELTERRRAEEALKEKNNELEKTLQQLRDMQNQLVIQEKMASLGALTAGIAHEIKNPLNFVNNFAELSIELTTELREELEQQKDQLDSQTLEEIEDTLYTLQQNVSKINEHGKRADSIVRNMLLHSRGEAGARQPTDINILLAEYVNLAYHGMRAEDSSFNMTLKKDYDFSVGLVEIVQQDMSRVFLNLVNNACYSVHQKKKELGEGYSPTLWVKTKNLGDRIEIRIRDNGKGIPQKIVDKIFNPFFTTKPTGKGTGLGLSISYDIVVQEHKGELKVETEEGNYAEFIITLPKK
ncbi:MAG: ATP-binding protein, partial [Nitrospira sp.]|nr:ATP-binding protein [Nitrospira sp.]